MDGQVLCWDSLINAFFFQSGTLIVYQRGLSHIFEKHIFDSAINGRNIFDKEQSYSSARVSGAIVGLTNEWIRRGMQDSPEYLAKFLNKEIEYKTI